MFYSIVIVCLSLPPTFLFAGSISQIKGLWSQRVAIRSKNAYRNSSQEKTLTISSFIKKVCCDCGVTEPELVVMHGRYLQTFIKGTLLRRRAYIFVSSEMIMRLNESELKAVVAHELGHLSTGIRKIEWLKTLSVVTFFSNYYLTLVLDTTNYEREADLFSLKVTADKDALISALIKTSIFNMEVLTTSQFRGVIRKLGELGWRRTMSLFLNCGLSLEFFFGKGLLGYSHPPLDQRIAYINGFATQDYL